MIYLNSGIQLLQKIYIALKPISPQKDILKTEISPPVDIVSPLLEPIDKKELALHEAEKIKAEEKHEQKVIESEILEEKILEEIQKTEKIESHTDIDDLTNHYNDIDNTSSLMESTETKQEKDTESNEDIVSHMSTEEVVLDSTTTTSDSPEASTETIETITHEHIALPITASIWETHIDTIESSDPHYHEKLYTLVSEVKTLLARGLPQDARALIIEWLSLDKNHRELNLILGSIYESERQPQKAEYIYKDLALIYPEDGEILERLANVLIIEKRYDIAIEIYKKIISITGETEWSLYIMTHLAHELGQHEELYAYARRYQKSWPNNPDILMLLAQAEIALGERQSAIQTLIKLKNLTPYNNEIMETIAKLTMEEELAGNFGGERI